MKNFNFPLYSFLISLETDGFRLTVHDYERIRLALGTGDKWTITRVRSVLAALLAKDEDQAQDFFRRFDDFFDPELQEKSLQVDVQKVIDDLQEFGKKKKRIIVQEQEPVSRYVAGKKKKPVPGKKKHLRRIFLTGIFLILGFACAVGGYVFFVPFSLVMSADPETLHFKNNETEKSVTITNKGRGVLNIKKVRLLGMHRERFRIVKNTCAGAKLEKGENCEIKVGFASEDIGTFHGVLIIETNAVNSPLIIQLRALFEKAGEISTVSEKMFHIYRDVPVIEGIDPVPASGSDDWKMFAWFSGLLLLLIIFFGVYLWESRKVPKDKEPEWDRKKTRYFPAENIGGKPCPRISKPALAHLADSMGYFRSEQAGAELDVPASIQATGDRGGVPDLVFFRRRQIRKLIILEDIFAEPMEWNTVSRELAQGMFHLGVPLLYGKFRGVPDQFFTEDGMAYYLEDLETDRRGYLLLIFSDGKGIHEQESRYILEAIARWPMKAWMELRSKEFWDETSAIPVHYGIPIYPATEDGLLCAFARFLTEKAEQDDFSEQALNWQGISVRGARSLPVYLEELAGDALPLAQACAMIQPVSFGMADALRREFYPGLLPERIERLLAVPGTTRNAAGLRFSNQVLAVLRSGFLARRTEDEQAEILEFILKKIDEVKPDDRDSLAYLSWEMTRERVNLDLNPDKALKRLSELSQTPLVGAVKGELEYAGFSETRVEDDSEEPVKIPLRKPPETRDGKQRLGAIAKNCGIPTLEVYPIALKNWVALFVLLLMFSSSVGMGVYEYSIQPDTRELTFINAENVEAEATLEIFKQGEWEKVVSGKVSDSLKWPLELNSMYQLTLSENIPENLAIIKYNLEITIGLEEAKKDYFVWVPGGCFDMGCGEWDGDCSSNEKPVHEVCVDGFWMGKTEITVGQWRIFVNETKYKTEAETSGAYIYSGGKVVKKEDAYWDNPYFEQEENQPVTCVSWNDVQSFIQWLNNNEKGKKYSLPSEAEWEYICRSGGKKEKFAGFSDESNLYQYANYCDMNCKFDWKDKNKNDGYEYTSPVGKYKPNNLGIYDMSGNVWEWCQDIYSEDAYKKHQRSNPIYTEKGSNRVIRGGSWVNNARDCRCAYRYRSTPDDRSYGLGFRLSRKK
ncbi:MAG: SUMF1/EgtB/PvdO family nonheme iron enzyme [Desulfobacterales bacterium]|nr:SUMF1/EgtB/PvdO family nonheme iron enzyme [Desulfobacterales bacterium]